MSDPITRLNAALEGRYRIEREIGEGGMATVYLADDLKHERKVALKVLKPELAAVVGADRFLAEIKTTANLQHPHILPLFDSGEADSFLFYVMPFVEGETLRDRINREKQLPVDEALGIATAVAGALQTAHDRGVVHRDIKPANILLSQGQPLVADFGIALAVSAGGSGRLTETGLSLGTPYYMSPEQATGDQAIGPASDTFALACVLYEMLIGEPPYPGNTAQAVLGKIIQGIPVSATSVRRTVPANVDAAIRKALEKLPADRFTGAQDFAKALADTGFRHGALAPGDVTVDPGPWKRVAAAFAVLFVAASAVAASAFLGRGEEPVRRVERFAAPFLEGQEHVGFTGWSGSDLSPDGSMLVYRHNTLQDQILMVRRWDDLTATPVRESTGGTAPAVSLDGLELAFHEDGEIRVLAFSGGPVRTLLRGTQAEWGPEGYVYATTDSGSVRVPSTGGAVDILSRLGEGEAEHIVRDVLPDGTLALIEVELLDGLTEIRVLDLGSGEMTPLVHGALPRYLPTGHLVYLVEGTMMAVRFDPDDGVIVGTPIAIMDGLSYFSIADDGKVYQVLGTSDPERGPTWQLSWVTRTGQTTPVDADWTFVRGANQDAGWRLSPDGSMVAVRQYTSSGYDIWVKRLETGPLSRLTFSDAHEKMPVWRPGQETVTFLSDRNGNFDVWSKPASGTGEAELIVDLDEDLRTFRWSPDGEWLLLETEAGDILASRGAQGEEPVPLLATRFQERYPAVSPDGRWIAYSSDETGRQEVYVAPFPDVGAGRWQVSINSGGRPEWERDGGGIIFDLSGVSTSMMVVEVETDRGFVAGTPRLLIDASGWGGGPRVERVYELGVNDDRLLVGVSPEAGPGGEPTGPRTILVNNFFEVLKRLVPN